MILKLVPIHKIILALLCIVFYNVILYLLDINECFANPCGDDQVCKNTNGSYLCTCTIGYVYNQINGTCDG